MSGIPYIHDTRMNHGQAEDISPLVRRVLANNMSPFTYTGTGTFIIGRGNVAVLDPGPNDPDHIEALSAALANETVSHILVTHTHLDHSPAAGPLSAITGAPVYAYGPHGSGRDKNAESGGLEGEEVEAGADMLFHPDVELRHGDKVNGDGWTIEAVHTPGHTSNHLCFALLEEETLFTGDHVMGWSTTIISPPDGDMVRYMESLEMLLGRGDKILRPTHGPAIIEPRPFLEALIAHRMEREHNILEAVKDGAASVADIVRKVYADVPEEMHPAAARSCLSHLLVLTEDGRVTCDGPATLESQYRVA